MSEKKDTSKQSTEDGKKEPSLTPPKAPEENSQPAEFTVEKAVKKGVHLKIALIGPSGSGKTWSALLLARGFGGRTVLIDTEARRSLYYAQDFDFDVIHMNKPFAPERYVKAITTAYKLGYQNLIIDSGSHEWIGIGGCLDIHEKMPGNSFANWAKVTPKHNKFIDCFVRVPMHTIVNLRGKDEYVMTEVNGKQVPKKVGLGPQMRAGLEYECTVSLMIDLESHRFDCLKDNTCYQNGDRIFDGRNDKIRDIDGKALVEWANSGGTKIEEKADLNPEQQAFVNQL